jgi:hypothetical protein
MQYDAAMQNGAPQPGAPQGLQEAPPAIPDYEQPPAPGDGYIWTPGYWAWTGNGYEWIQGAWVAAPYTGALWTPGYWGYGYGGYFWNTGYWGPYVGYYGGINYGFGYFGIGFYGGYWGGGRFWYNRSYCNLGRGYGFHNVYSRSYNGYSGRPGGVSFSRSGFNNRGAGAEGFRGSGINGHTSSFAQGTGRANYTGAIHNDSRSFNGAAGTSNAGRSFAGNDSRSYSGSGNNNGGARNFSQPTQNYNAGTRSFSQPAQNYGSATRSFSQPTQNYGSATRSFSQPSQSYGGGARSYSAPAGGNYGGGMSTGGGSFHSGGSGGSFQGGGGGGGFHGGGGGGGGSHGGGGGHR